MRASVGGRDELVLRVQQRLALPTKKQAEMVVDAVVSALEESCQKVSVDIVFLGLQAGGQKGIRRSRQNSIIFNVEIFDFDGSPGIPSD